MRLRRMNPPARRTTRRWRTPPAIMHGDETFEGLGLLEEFDGALGILLWQSVRDVQLRADTSEDRRAGLFADDAEDRRIAAVRAAGLDVQVEPPLMAIARMLGDPAGARAESIATACQHIAYWADGRGALRTAIVFTQAAAVTLPHDAASAYAVGRLTRRNAELARAETWYRRAVALGRQSGDWNSYALAFLGLGNLYAQRGSYPAARRFQIRALRAARRHSLRQVQGMALHDLFVLASHTGQERQAEEFSRAAFEAYGPDHPRLAMLAQDIAWHWMERGQFEPALAVFQALLPHMSRPEERLVVLANVARAAAGAGERRLFDETWNEVWDGVARADSLENAATVLVDLAHGATTVGEPERAERAAERAVEIASQRGESKTRLTAEALLDKVRRSRGATAREEPAAVEAPEETDSFARDLVRSLNASLVAR